MEFHHLLVTVVSLVGITQGTGEFKRHLFHETTEMPIGIGEGDKCEYGYTRHHGTIESPNFPNRYNNSIDCHYHIYAGEGNVIHIQFWMMDIEEHSNCNYDYLEIQNASLEVMGKYCGSEVPDSLNITDTAHLHFHSDFNNNQFGFQIEYFVSHSNCIFGEKTEGCALPCNCETSAHNLVTCDRQTGQCIMGMCRNSPAVDDMLADVWGGPACQIGNVAYNKPTGQVGTYNNMDSSKAVDRRLGWNDQQKYCAHPDSKSSVAAWWTVDLGSVHKVFNITIYNTQDIGGAKRLEDFSVRYGLEKEISLQENCTIYKPRVEDGEHVTLSCDDGEVLARYISIVREGGFQVTMMTLCEVVVVGHPYTDVACSLCDGHCVPDIYCDHCVTGYLAPSCRVPDTGITCPNPPPAPAFGVRVISGTSYLDVVNYGCNAGFYISGESQLECGLNGQWSGQAPICARINCGEAPAAPSWGNREGDGTLYEDMVFYTCDEGYLLEGSEEIVCEASGLWSDQAPICRREDLTCGDPPVIQYGVVSPVNGTTFNSLAEYVCDGFLEKGSGYLVCTSSSVWIPLGEESECSDCGGAVKALEVSTMISHPMDTEKYKHSENCTWIIYASKPGASVEITWFHMDIESHVSCIHDSLTVYDSNGDQLHKIIKYCGDEMLDTMTSEGHSMILNFQSDESVEMTGFKAEFKQVQERIDHLSLLETFYPDLGRVLGITEQESGLSSALMYLLDIEISRQEETPTYVYLVQSIDAVTYLLDMFFLPHLQQYFMTAFEHTLSHSLDTRLSDIEVAHQLFAEVSEPIKLLLNYLLVDFGDRVSEGKRVSCFEEIYRLAEAAVGEHWSNGQTFALEVLEAQRGCVELIRGTDKRHFLDQMQSGPFDIYTGSMSAQSMYMLVKAYVESSVLDSRNRLEQKYSSIPDVVSSVFSESSVIAIYLEELRLHVDVLTDTIEFLDEVRYNFTSNAEQYLTSLDLGWKLPPLDQYGRPVLHSLLNHLLHFIGKDIVQVELYYELQTELALDTPMSQVRARHLETLADELVVMLDSEFETECGHVKMAALLVGFAEVKMLDVAESKVCIQNTANSVESSASINCEVVNHKALAFYRELLASLGDSVDNILGGSVAAETIPLGLVLQKPQEKPQTLGKLTHYILGIAVPRFQETWSCDVSLDVPKLAESFTAFYNRLNAVNDLAEAIVTEMSENSFVDAGVQDEIKDILRTQFSHILDSLEPFTSINTYPGLVEAVSNTLGKFLAATFLDLSEQEVVVDITPVIDMLEKQDLALEDFVRKLAHLREDMITAMAGQGVDICSAAPQLC